MGFKELHNEMNERMSLVCIRNVGLYLFTLARPLTRGLPKQFIRQPPVRPFGMTVSFVAHFIQTTACFRISESAGANIRREIIHTRRSDTGYFTRFTENVYFL